MEPEMLNEACAFAHAHASIPTMSTVAVRAASHSFMLHHLSLFFFLHPRCVLFVYPNGPILLKWAGN